jgi:type II secretory pathway component GspD/PulD (secretin)
MNKTKLLVGAVLAGIVLQPVFSQPAASVATTNPAVYGAMVSNVIRLSTGNNEISVAPSNGNPEASSEISNQYSAPSISNPPPLAVVSNESSAVSTGSAPAVLVASNNSAAGAVSNPPANAAAISNMPVPAVAVTNVTVTPVGSNAHSELIVTTTVSNQPLPASSASNAVSAPADSNENALADNTNSSANNGADTNSQSAASADTNAIPETTTIRFQDIPITSVIENLARQAGINYLLDPKIGYGQVDPATGQTKPEPSLSLRWENITPEQALIAVLDNYGLQLTVDPKTKIAKVTIKSPDALPPLITHVYQLAYASVSNVITSVQTILTDKRSKVVTDGRTSQLIVLATDPEQTDVDSLIKKLDKPTRQVLIETRFIEISSNPTTTKGVDWTGTLQAQNITFGNGAYSQVANNTISTVSQTANTASAPSPSGRTPPAMPGTTTTVSGNNIVNTIASSGPGVAYNTLNGFNPAGGFLSANGLSAVLSFINSSSDAQVVSTPRIVTLDNEQASIAVTRAFPIFATTAGTQGSPGGSSVTYSNVGIILLVTPHISANDYIWMKVTPSISSFYATVTKTISGEVNQADEFDSRNIDTQVLIPNANTLVMGGMVKDNPNATYTKVPLLGDIPVFGWAFRSETKSIDKQNLLIFITPTILKDSDFQPTVTDFMNSRPIKEKEPLDPNSAWDSGKPHDWSNPKNTDPTQIIINQKTTE